MYSYQTLLMLLFLIIDLEKHVNVPVPLPASEANYGHEDPLASAAKRPKTSAHVTPDHGQVTGDYTLFLKWGVSTIADETWFAP
jgi:hypothetical protein